MAKELIGKGATSVPLSLVLMIFSLTIVSNVVEAADMFEVSSPTSFLGETDDAWETITLRKPVTVSGMEASYLEVTTNGFLYFDIGVDSGPLPYAFALLTDLVNPGSGISSIWFDQTTGGPEMAQYMDSIHVIDTHFDADFAVIVSWNDVLDFPLSSGRHSSFQFVVAIDRNRNKTYAIFNYNKIESRRNVLSFGYHYGNDSQLLLSGDDINNSTAVLMHSNIGIPGRYVILIDGVISVESCEEGWERSINGETCLKVMSERKRNFKGARKECAKVGADLATSVFSLEDMQLIADLYGSPKHLWVGVRSSRGENVRYVNGLPVTGVAPFKERRQNSKRQIQNCVTVKNDMWHDRNCYKKYYFVCEK